MKILAYSQRKDEIVFFKKFSSQYSVNLDTTEKAPSLETSDLSKGYDAIIILTTPMDKPLLEKFKENGIKFISTRTVGYDHIDIEAARKLGIGIGNATYSPDSVADYTIMLMLMAIRKIKLIMQRSSSQDFSLNMTQGKGFPKMTIGVIGTGRIGQTLIKHLSGFGCKILAHDLYENEELKNFCTYETMDNLLKNSDIITLHMPATNENYHMINKNTINKMKDGVFIINTSRGSLINTEDFISAIENGKIGGAALDVIENETSLYYNDLKGEVISNHDLAILNSFPNVIVTPHMAFYTDQSVSDMIENSIKSIVLFNENKENPWKVA